MFNGFTENTGNFMWELMFNNERPWFIAHKQEFEEYVNTPFKALAEDTFYLLNKAFPDMTFYIHVSRIYRDARRLHGRGPYKERLWFSIKTEPSDYDGPVFWFELGAADYAFGMGYWGTPSSMELFRSTVDANPAAFERLAEGIAKHPELKVGGEEYKRPKGSYEPPVSLWYNLKHPGIVCRRDFGGDLFSPDLPRLLCEEYSKMMPMFSFLLGIYNRSKG